MVDSLFIIYFIMLRLICVSPLFRFCAVPHNETQAKYVIKSKSYLIEAPPKRPASGWTLFIKQQLAGKKNSKVATEFEALGKKWKSYAEIREKFNKLAEQRNQGYQKIRDEYEKNYLIPFKRITGHNLRLKKLFTDKKVEFNKNKGIAGIGEQVRDLFKQQPRTLKEDEELKQQAKKISEEREALRKKYEFPKLQHPTLLSFKLRHSIPVDQRGPTYEQDIANAYKNYLATWKAQVTKWLADNKYHITFEQFEALHKKSLKKVKKNDDSSEDSD